MKTNETYGFESKYKPFNNIKNKKGNEMKKNTTTKRNSNKEVEKLIRLVKDFIRNIDEEMEHGCYETPEDVPYQYEDEEDYYGEHDKITDRVVASRLKIRKFIEKYQKSLDN